MGRPHWIRPTGDISTAMTRDANSHFRDDPARRWSSQLEGLFGRRRESVLKALRNSVDSGYPANSDGVRILVAYAQGQISARQYVAQILESLGFVPPAYTPAPVVRAPEPWREPVRRPDPSTDALLPQFRPRSKPVPMSNWGDSWADEPRRSPAPEPAGNSRQQAVRAYISGQIPVEEFLRRSDVHST